MPLLANPSSTIFINEIHYDDAGTDANEFIEIAGPAGTSLTGYSIVLYNGSGGASYDTDALSGTIPAQQGGYGTVALGYAVNGIQNGSPDGVALVGPGNALIQFLCYEGTFTAANGPASGVACTDIGVSEDGSEADGQSLRLTGTGTTYGEFTWAAAAPHTSGAVNTGQTFGAPTPTPTPTSEPTPTPTPDPTPTPTPTPPPPTNIIINELDSDTPGADAAEFIELYDGGAGNTSLSGLVVVLYNGSNDLSYRAVDLDGFTTNAAGYLTIGNAAVPGVDVVIPNDSIQNGQDAAALYAGDASGFPNGTAVTTANLIDAVVYDTADPDDPGLLVLLNAGEPQVDENTGGGGQNNSSGRCPNGSGGARNTASYTQAAPSPDGPNNCPLPPQVRTIPEIQGNTGTSPYDGVLVTTTGVVTARKTNGFFLQDAAGDGDPATSDAVFVFTSSAPTVAVGDAVQVTGAVDEFRAASSAEASTPADPETLTEIVGPLTINLLSSGNPLPAPVDATALGVFTPGHPSRGAQLERYEAMRMSVAAITVSHATNGFGEFWGVEPPRPRPFREPGIEAGDPIPSADEPPFAPNPPPAPPIFDGNFERVMVDSDDATTAAGTRRASVNVTTGTLVTGIVGPLDYAFDNFRIVLDSGATPATAGGVTAATPVPARTAQEFTIAHANLENFGVSNANFAARLEKASLAVRNVLRTPDILGVIEVFDLPSLQQLAAKVNADAADPGVNYVAYLEESASTFADSQDVGYLVNTARVTVVGTPEQYHRDLEFTYLNEQPDLLHDRPAYILTAD
ncbi:MAG TPA: hypothetical protein VN228_19230, partial [Pyrinomonadaceae bacterium]|nr:hypothetical protein [Pyrinomonadaceae bacterium]